MGSTRKPPGYRQTALAWFLLGWFSASATATELTFEIDGLATGARVPQEYGDRVSSTSKQNPFRYGSGGGLTPQVVVSYGPDDCLPIYRHGGFGSLKGVITAQTGLFDEFDEELEKDGTAAIEIRFHADIGRVVRLERWEIAAAADEQVEEDPMIRSIEVFDQNSEKTLYSEKNPIIPDSGRRVFSFESNAFESQDLVLRITVGESNQENQVTVGLDHITFSQFPPPPLVDPVRTYDDIVFDSGDASFADRVVFFEPEFAGGELPQNRDLSQAIGPPDYSNDVTDSALSLGSGGRLTVEFIDNVLTTSGDEAADLAIFEVDTRVEAAHIEISADGEIWHSVGTIPGGTALIDIDQFGFQSGETFRFVRLTDDPNEGRVTQPSPGADIDAIGAITSSPKDGGITGQFGNPRGPGGMVVTGMGTAFFTWGQATRPPVPSSLRFRPGFYDGGVETEFDLGTLTYFNGTTDSGSEAESVILTIVLDT
jgi:hypothetical protein